MLKLNTKWWRGVVVSALRTGNTGQRPQRLGRMRRRMLLLTALVATAMGRMPDRANAASNDDFKMTTSADWVTGTHWSSGAAPTSSVPVFIEDGGTCTLNGSGKAGNSLTIGANDGSYSGDGTLSLTSGAVLTISNGLQFGPSSGTVRNGTLDIAGGVLSLGGGIAVGASAGTATINLSGGTLSLAGNNITPGSNINNFNFNFSGGTLQNVGVENANINFSGGTVYTTSPTSTFNGTFTGSGGILTTSGSGVLALASTTGISDLSLSIGAGSTVQFRGANQISSTGSVALGGGTLDLNTYSATVSGLSGSGTIDTLAGGTPIVTVGNYNASSTFGGTLQNSAGALSLLKTGSGTLDLSSANTYTGATTVSNGALLLDHGAGNSGVLGATAVSVSGGAALVVRGNTSLAPGGSLTVAGGAAPASQGVVDLRDGTINTLTVNGNLALGNGSGGAALDFELGGSGVDQISATSIALSGTSTINLSSLGSFPAGSSYPLITVSGGTLNAGQFQLGAEPAGFVSFGLAAAPGNSQLVLSITANATPGTAYWTGKGSLLTSDSPNYWNSGGTSGSSNWGQNADGSNDPLQVPGTTTNVILAATNVAGSGALTTTLDHNYLIQSLTFAVPASTAITGVVVNTATNSLTIGSGGLTLSAVSSSGGTLGGAGGVVVNGNQSWANNSNSQNLTISAPITAAAGPTTLTLNGTGAGGVTFSGGIANGNGGGPLALSFGQAGATLLSGSNTYSGGTTVSAGSLQLGGSGALPAGQALAVNGGMLDLNGFSQNVATLNGSGGTIQSSAAAATLTAGAGGANSAYYGTIQNGSGSVALSKTGSGVLTLFGNNSYTGGTSLTAGELAVGSGSGLGSGPLTLGGGTLATAGGAQTLGNAVLATSAAQAFDTTSGTLTFTGAISAMSGGTAQNLYSKYGPNALTFLNSTGTLGGGLAVYAGSIVFDGANLTDPYDTLRWQNTSGTTAIVITDNANLQLGAADKNVNSKMGQTAATKANPAYQFLTLSSGTLAFVSSTQFHQLFVGDSDYNTSTVNQNGGLLSFATTSTGDGVELALTANASGVYNLNGGILLTPAVTGGSGNSAFFFGGGTLQANTNNANFFPNQLNQASTGLQSGSTAFINDGGYSIAISQSLSGWGGLTKLGTGTLTLAGTNSYLGGTTISQGTLAVSSDSNLGDLGGGLSIGPATLLVQGNIVNSSRSLILADPTATIQVAPSFAYSNSAAISGTGGLTKNGAGLLTLSGPNLYSGGTTLAAGTLAVGSAGALGSGTLTISGGALDAALPVTLSTYAVPQAWNGDFAFGGSNPLNTGLGAVTLGGNRTVTVNGGSALTIGGPIGDNNAGYGLTKAGSGTLVLASSNSYSGATTISGGALVVDQSGNNSGALGGTAVSVNGGAALVVRGNASIAAGGSLTVAGGASPATVDLRDGNINTLTVNGYLFLQGNAGGGAVLDFDLGNGSADQIATTGTALITGSSNTINLNPVGVITTGSYPLITASSGLSASNFVLGSKPAGFYTFSLATTSASTLVLSITGASTPSTVYWTGNASQLGGDNANSWGTGYNSNTVSNWSTTVDGSTDPKQVPGGITSVFFTAANATGGSSGGLATTLDVPYSINSLTFGVSAGTITGVTVNTGTNSLTIGSGGLTLSAASNASATIGGTGAVRLNGSQSWSNYSNNQGLTVNSPVTALAGLTTLTVQGPGGVTFGGALADGGGQLALNVNSGVTVLLGSNTYSGGTTINGGTLELGSGGSGASIGSAGSLLDDGALVFNHSDSVVFSSIVSGYGSLTQAGTGILTLLGNNTYSGGTTIAGGTLQVGNGGSGVSIGETSNVLNNGSLVFNHNDNVTFSPSISGSGSLRQTGSGTLTLLGNNTYSGGTTINSGMLQVGNGGNGASMGSSSVLDNGSLVFNHADATSVSSISGSGGLTQTGAGVLTLLGANSYSGTTTITAGVLAVGQSSALSANSNLVFNGAGNGAGGVLQTSGTLNLSTGTGPGQVQWTKKAGGFAAQGGPLTVTLDGGETETWGVSPFNVSGGLIFGSATADSPVVFTNSINLNSGNRTIYAYAGVGGDYALISGNLITSGSDTTSNITKSGNGMLILTGSNFYPGPTTISGGTLQIGNGGNSGTLGSGTVSVSSGAALVFDRGDNGLVVSNAISGAGSLAQIGSGTLILSGTNSYTGGTNVEAGTLYMMDSGALADGTSLTVGAGSAFLFGSSLTTAPAGEAASGKVIVAVPEPGTLTLLAAGLVAALGGTWKRAIAKLKRTACISDAN